jgi:hypothetical protein
MFASNVIHTSFTNCRSRNRRKSNHALRDAFQDRDHGIPSPLPDIHHERAAAVEVLLLVARPHPPLHLTGCFLLHPVGVRERHSCRGGAVCARSGTPSPYAMVHRSAWSFFYSLIAEPDFCGRSQMAWVSFTMIFGLPVLMRLERHSSYAYRKAKAKHG